MFLGNNTKITVLQTSLQDLIVQKCRCFVLRNNTLKCSCWYAWETTYPITPSSNYTPKHSKILSDVSVMINRPIFPYDLNEYVGIEYNADTTLKVVGQRCLPIDRSFSQGNSKILSITGFHILSWLLIIAQNIWSFT